MKLNELRSIKKTYFDYLELARTLQISPSSARVAGGRYVKQGVLVRVKRNLYMLREIWENADREEKFRIANLGQVPSYISLTTALDYYDLTTQMQRDFLESVAVRRTKEIQLDKTIFKYTKISNELYFGFKKVKNIFIATPEKALLDAFYLLSLGRYSLDLSAVDAGRLDREQILLISEKFPVRTKEIVQSYGYLRTT